MKLRVPSAVQEELKMIFKARLVEIDDYDQVYVQALVNEFDELVKWMDSHSKADYYNVLCKRAFK